MGIVKPECQCGHSWSVHTHFSEFNHCGHCKCARYHRSLLQRLIDVIAFRTIR